MWIGCVIGLTCLLLHLDQISQVKAPLSSDGESPGPLSATVLSVTSLSLGHPIGCHSGAVPATSETSRVFICLFRISLLVGYSLCQVLVGSTHGGLDRRRTERAN